MTQTRRIFIGLPLAPQMRKRLKQEMASWPKEALLQTAEENLHVTLMFLGFVNEERIPEICRSVEQAVSSHEAFELQFTGMELREDREHPKMVWLSGEPSEELRLLYEDLEKAFSSFVTGKKQFRPHITLAKIKKSRWLKLPSPPEFKTSLSLVEPIDTVAVFESLVIDGKRRYEQIDSFPLV